MNIKILLFAIVVVALGTGVFFWQLGRTVPADSQPSAEDVDEQTSFPELPPLNGRGPLSGLRALGQDVECAVFPATEGEVAIREGSVFVSQGRIRGDFLLEGAEPVTVSSMIIANGTLFTWSVIEGQSYGVQVDLAAAGEAPTLDAREPVSLDDEIRYDCKPWGMVDNSVFAPPGDVLFRDLSSVVEQGMEYGTVFEEGTSAADSAACIACDTVTDADAQEMCRIQNECGPQVR